VAKPPVFSSNLYNRCGVGCRQTASMSRTTGWEFPMITERMSVIQGLAREIDST
jgi:hypothetical protein